LPKNFRRSGALSLCRNGDLAALGRMPQCLRVEPSLSLGMFSNEDLSTILRGQNEGELLEVRHPTRCRRTDRHLD
jgi:hypothetical protein